MSFDGRPIGRSRRHHGAWAAVLAVLLGGLAVAGCLPGAGPTGSASSGSPDPTPTASPTPSPDVAGAFLRQIADPAASGAAELSGIVIAGEVDGTVSGEIVFDGSDVRSSLTLAIGDRALVAERARIGADGWDRVAPGPWLASEPRADEPSLPSVLSSIDAVEDVGPEPSGAPDGAPVHRLRPTTSVALPAPAFGLTDPAAADADVSVELLVRPDGTPATILVDAAWTQDVDGAATAIDASFEIAIVRWQAVVSIRPPSDVWVVHRSEAIGYAMARPADWTVRTGEDADAFALDDVEYLHVATQDLGSTATLEQFRDAVVRSAETELGGKPAEDEAVRLGGQPARRLVYRLTNEAGNPIVLVDYLVVRGSVGWEVYLATVAGDDEAAERAFFETFIATFRFLE
ncbi:MAG TPA: hypothetical protein VFR14_14295 [Candidatus Limnocylindrales bacterium]|nr:hypothetical protein [Candidatus Limnocylindrales bacterium]